MKVRILYAMTVLLAACGGGSMPEPVKHEPAQKTVVAPQPVKEYVEAPTCNADSAYGFVKNQVDFGPRVPNTKEHVLCKDYLVAEFNRFGLETSVQEADLIAYNGTALRSFNITAKYDPTNTNRIMVAAHWDSRPYADRDKRGRAKAILGANDGASGVGVILELARVINSSESKPSVGIDFVLFDSEDYGKPQDAQVGSNSDTWCLGSQYWSNNLPSDFVRPRFGILMDMVGAKDATFPKDAISVRFAPQVVEKVWASAKHLGYDSLFTSTYSRGELTDDHTYINYLTGIKMIDIIHYDPVKLDFGSFHHTHKDNMDVIHGPTLQKVGNTVLSVLYNE